MCRSLFDAAVDMCLPVKDLCKIIFFMCAIVIEQSHPTTFFAAISAGRSRYCLEISKAQERPTIVPFF